MARVLRRAWVAPTAHVHSSAVLSAGVWVGPGAYVGPRCSLAPGVLVGARSSLAARTTVGPNCSLLHAEVGEGCTLHANVAIGGDGFGFSPEPWGLRKKPQLLRVRIGAHVEIGAGVTIDRGSWRDTAIGTSSPPPSPLPSPPHHLSSFISSSSSRAAAIPRFSQVKGPSSTVRW